MTNNDILTRLRYTFDYTDAVLVTIFAAAEHTVTKEQVKNWLSSEENPSFVKLSDNDLAHFLNGLINHRRGKRPGPQPVAEMRLNNNLIVTKLKIALNLKGEDMINLLDLADFPISNHELSAFFRKPGNRHFRNMNDQVLRYFLRGLQLKHRPGKS
jgi:uncharacterized protein YehS (DUF1456 family)